MQQNEIKLNLKQYLPENWDKIAETSNSWPNTFIAQKYRPNPEKIPEKWDKNKNNGFGLGPQFLIIKSQHFEWKSMKNQWKLNEISGKIQRKYWPTW